MTHNLMGLPALEKRAAAGELNDVILFDGEGRFITRSTADIPILKKDNFFDLLSDSESDFFREWSRTFMTGRLLLDTSRGMALVFCRLYPVTGVFFAVMFHTSREAMRRFWQNGILINTRVSPTLIEKTLPRKEGTLDEISFIEKRLGLCNNLFTSAPAAAFPSGNNILLPALAADVRALARLFGCGFTCREETRGNFADCYVFSVPSFCIILSCLFSCLRLYGVGEEPQISVYEEDGRVCIRLKREVAGIKDKASKTYRFSYPELEFCRALARRNDLLLDILIVPQGETADFSARFSPQYRDPAVLGLKNNFRFN